MKNEALIISTNVATCSSHDFTWSNNVIFKRWTDFNFEAT